MWGAATTNFTGAQVNILFKKIQAVFEKKLHRYFIYLAMFPSFLMLVAIFVSIPFMAYQAIFSPGPEGLGLTNALYVALLIPVAVYLSQLWQYWSKVQPKLFNINYLLLLWGLMLILNRFAIYFHVIDDFYLHLNLGYSARTIWNNANFLPFGGFTYLYPFLHVAYSYLIDLIGIRLTLLFLDIGKLFWLLNLNVRYGDFLKKRKGIPFWLTNIIFALLYSMPEVTVSHVTFMTDAFSLLFCLEFLYIFLIKGSYRLLIVMYFGAFLSKQSSGFMQLPLSTILLVIAAKRNIKEFIKETTLPIMLVASNFVRTWVETLNPLAGLYNQIFKSSVYGTFRSEDSRWGPLTWYEALAWPVYAPFSTRYMEFPMAERMPKIIYAIQPIGTFIAAVYLASKKKNFILVAVVLNFWFWAYVTGYGRYYVALTAMSLFLVLNTITMPKFKAPKMVIFSIVLVLYTVVSLSMLSSFRSDYAWRPQFSATWSRFWHLNYYFKETFAHGLRVIGHDRTQDAFQEIKGVIEGSDYKSIIIGHRGVSTWFGHTLSRYSGLPLYYASDADSIERIEQDSRVPEQIKRNAALSATNLPALLVSENEEYITTHVLPTTKVFEFGTCQFIGFGPRSTIFSHPNYYEYVRLYRCEEK